MRRLLLLAACAAFLLAGCGGSSGPGAKEVAYDFVFNVKHANYYTACQLYSKEMVKTKIGTLDQCSEGFVETAGMYALLSGTNPYSTVSVKPRSFKELPNGDAQISFLFAGKAGGTATLHKYPEGWRITEIA